MGQRRIRAACVPERAHLGERDALFPGQHQLLIDLQPGDLPFLKENVTRSVLISGGEDVINGHASRVIPWTDNQTQEISRNIFDGLNFRAPSPVFSE